MKVDNGLFIAVCCVCFFSKYGCEDDERIVGGTDARNGNVSYQVSLRANGHHMCGGSVIDKNWVLTAAHCVEGQKMSHFGVVAGTILLNSGGDNYTVKRIIRHPSYDPKDIKNDIALIQLEDEIHFTENVAAVRLPVADTEEGTKLMLSGWGSTSYPSGKVPNTLQTISLYAISNEECASIHSQFVVHESNLCTLTKSGEGACHGDSGGPLVNGDIQVGVVSWGTPCAKGKPDVFTRVYPYVDWIKENIN